MIWRTFVIYKRNKNKKKSFNFIFIRKTAAYFLLSVIVHELFPVCSLKPAGVCPLAVGRLPAQGPDGPHLVDGDHAYKKEQVHTHIYIDII